MGVEKDKAKPQSYSFELAITRAICRDIQIYRGHGPAKDSAKNALEDRPLTLVQ